MNKNIIESTIVPAAPIVRGTSREQGTCPVCNGTMVSRRKVWSNREITDPSYDPVTETVECRCGNCGAQYMFGRPTGKTYLRADGTPCKHSHKEHNIGRCFNQYDCIYCVDSYTIDSSD